MCIAFYEEYKSTKGNSEYNNQIETIEKEGNAYNAPKITSIKYNATNLENSDISSYNEINDNIEGREKKTYRYYASESGIYAFYFEKDSNLEIDFYVYDKKGNEIGGRGNYTFGLHGNLANVELEKNVQYSITINNTSKTNSNGKYTMFICPPKKIADVTDYSIINDNIQYEKQKITYKYTAPTTGEYEFIKRNVTVNSIDIEIVDENKKSVLYYSSKSGSNTKNAKLEKGKNYYIIVTENSSHGFSYDYERYGDLGSYTILIKKG